MSFQAIVARETDGKVVANLDTLNLTDLPAHPVLVEVTHSSLNYKDALALSGNRNKIMKSMPFVPGIDLAGRVVESSDPGFAAGDSVLATGWGLGERDWGGFARYARLKPNWLTRLPAGFDGKHAMALGTAGLTAMLCVEAIEEAGVKPAHGEILVTGATGGVGSIAILLLKALGYSPVASTGRPEQAEYLQSIGAARVVARSEFDRDARPLEQEIWPAAIDTIGDRTLAVVLAQTRYGGTVAACGLAGGYNLPTTVMPFILRNVRLQGIDSVYVPAAKRGPLWQRLAQIVPTQKLDTIVQETKLGGVLQLAGQMIAGQSRGRSIVVMD